MLSQLREWKRVAKRDTRVSLMALRDPRAPWHVKALAALTAIYTISPVDLVPDFLPLHGIIDDLVVIPLAIALMVHLIPVPLKAELHERAEAAMANKRPHSRIPELLIAICLVGIASVIAWLIWFR